MTAEAAPLRMRAYYYEFTPTGVRHIDLILCAVASAGKAFHYTADWHDEVPAWDGLRGGTPIEWIQNAANDAAAVSMLAPDAAARAAIQAKELARVQAVNDGLARRVAALEKAGEAMARVLAIRSPDGDPPALSAWRALVEPPPPSPKTQEA